MHINCLLFAAFSDSLCSQGISDNLMDALSSLFFLSLPSEAASAQQKSYVTYTLSSLPSYNGKTPTITLLEAQNMVAASGTTGTSLVILSYSDLETYWYSSWLLGS